MFDQTSGPGLFVHQGQCWLSCKQIGIHLHADCLIGLVDRCRYERADDLGVTASDEFDFILVQKVAEKMYPGRIKVVDGFERITGQFYAKWNAEIFYKGKKRPIASRNDLGAAFLFDGGKHEVEMKKRK